MSAWRECNLGDVLKPKGYIRGPFGSSLKRNEMLTSGYPVYEQEQAIRNTRNFRYFINNEKLQEMHRFIVKPNDLIISCSGTVGRISVIRENDEVGIISQALLLLRSNDKIINNTFLKYFLLSPQGQSEILSRADGSVQVNIAKREIIETIPITLPPLPEQQAIAEVLSSLDDKIDLLNRQNKTLEALAETHFRQWFIEEADENWEVGRLGDYVSVIDNRGKTPPYQDVPTEYPVIEVRSIAGDSRFIDYGRCEKFVTKETYENWFRGHPKKNDILVSTVGSIGELAVYLDNIGTIAQNVIALQARKVSPFYLYQFLLFKKHDIKELDIGSVQPSIKVPHLLNIDFILPDEKTMNRFDNLAAIISKKMLNNSNQIQTLQNLRDTLLTKLISGEVRVKI